VSTRRQITCGSPSTIASPYWKVDRASSAQVISKYPGCPLHAFDAEALPELTALPQVLDELLDRRQEGGGLRPIQNYL